MHATFDGAVIEADPTTIKENISTAFIFKLLIHNVQDTLQDDKT